MFWTLPRDLVTFEEQSNGSRCLAYDRIWEGSAAPTRPSGNTPFALP